LVNKVTVKKSKEKIDEVKNPKTIEEKLKRLCTERFNLNIMPFPNEYSKKVLSHHIKVHLYVTPLQSLPSSGSKSNLYSIMNEISDLETEIPLTREKIKPLKRLRKLKQLKSKQKIELRELKRTLTKDKVAFKRKTTLVKTYNKINKRLSKLMKKNGFVSQPVIGKEVRWMKAVTTTTIKIVTLQIV